MAELVYAPALGAGPARVGSSSLPSPTLIYSLLAADEIDRRGVHTLHIHVRIGDVEAEGVIKKRDDPVDRNHDEHTERAVNHVLFTG